MVAVMSHSLFTNHQKTTTDKVKDQSDVSYRKQQGRRQFNFGWFRQFCILFFWRFAGYFVTFYQTLTMTENTFPVYNAEAIVNFYRTEILAGQEAKQLTKGDLAPVPKVTCCKTTQMSSDEKRNTTDIPHKKSCN